MGCPTCDHTMESCTLTIKHCPRCGTMQMDGTLYVPKLVTRCRMFMNTELHTKELRDFATILGLFESIYPPTERPPV